MPPGVIFVNSDVLHPLNSIAVGGGEGLSPKNPTPEVSYLYLPPFEVHNRPAFFLQLARLSGLARRCFSWLGPAALLAFLALCHSRGFGIVRTL